MEPACLIMSLLCRFLDGGFIRLFFYLILWSYVTYHDKIIISFCDINDDFVMDVSYDVFPLNNIAVRLSNAKSRCIMRKTMTRIVLIMLAGVMAVFSSCQEEETNVALPEISFANGEASVTLEPGDSTHTISGTISAPGGLKFVQYFEVTDQGKTQLDLVEEFDDPEQHNFSYTVEGIGHDMTIQVEATDQENQTVSKDYSIDFTPHVVNAYTDKILGSYDSNTGSSFASIDGTVYSFSEAGNNSEEVDLMYYYGQTNGATIAAPNDPTADDVYPGLTNWSTRNSTQFKTTDLTAEDFDGIAGTDDSQIVSAAEGADQTSINSLAEGDVIGFITASTSAHPDKMGLIKVISIEGSGGTSTITIAVKVQV